MKRLLLLFLLLPLPLFAQDESVFSSRAWREFHNGLTPGGLFGVPRYATTGLPTCNSSNPGALVWDTTALTFKGCNGTSWGNVGGTADPLTLGNVYGTTSVCSIGALDTAGSVCLTSGAIIAEGATANTAELTLSFNDVTNDAAVVFGEASGEPTVGSSGTNAISLATNGTRRLYVAGNGAYVANDSSMTRLGEAHPIGWSDNSSALAGTVLSRTTAGGRTGITEGSAQSIITVAIPTSTDVYGMFVTYTVYDINGANYVARTGSVKVQGGNSGGTATCTINTTQDAESEDGSQIVTSNAATLTYTWTNVVSTTNCVLSLNAASSEGTNTYGVTWIAQVNGNSGTVTVATN